VIGSIVAAQREELEREIGELKVEAERIAGEAREVVGEEMVRLFNPVSFQTTVRAPWEKS
jgi:hypothetical protein